MNSRLKHAEVTARLLDTSIKGGSLVSNIMQIIIYYISGHGYGHSTRSVELIKTLITKNPNLFFHIKTDAPGWIFKLNLNSNYRLYHLNIDVGAVQETSFHINKRETYGKVNELFQKKKSIIETEVAFARQINADLIIADIPPLAFEIAHAAAIPSMGLANFSWDWIYADYVNEMPGFADLINEIKTCYAKANLLLRLPLHGDLSVFPQIKDIPLIARRDQKSKQEVRRILGYRKNNYGSLALVAFRANDLKGVDMNALQSLHDFMFVTLGLWKEYENCINLPADAMHFYDLLNACDVVISKPGYGLVAEVVANRTPVLYTSRDDFAEYEVLVKGLKEFAVCRFLSRDNFLSGNWAESLGALLNQPVHWKPVDLDGADSAANEVLNLLATV